MAAPLLIQRPAVGRRVLRAIAISAAATLLSASPLMSTSARALCGDSTGDGFVRASDALATLRLAVTDVYDDLSDANVAGGDGRVLASDALAILLAAVNKRIPSCAAASERLVAVSTASRRFDAAGVSVVDIATGAIHFRAGVLHPDSVVRRFGSEAVFLNRFGANSVQRLDLDDPQLPTLKECSVADGVNANSNPHDVILVGNRGYVSLYNSSSLLVIDPDSLRADQDPACANLIVDHIDLGPLADADGLPEMDQMGVFDGKLYVSLQLLDRGRPLFPPSGPGRLAVIDLASDSVVGSIDLQIENPFLETKGLLIDSRTGILYIGGPGRISRVDIGDGGIEAVDLKSGLSLGVLITGAQLGGDLFDLVVVGSRRAYGVVADAESSRLVEIDLENGLVKAELLSSNEAIEAISDIEMTQSGQLWVAFRSQGSGQRPGLRVFSLADNRELSVDPIFPGSLPFTLTFAP